MKKKMKSQKVKRQILNNISQLFHNFFKVFSQLFNVFKHSYKKINKNKKAANFNVFAAFYWSWWTDSNPRPADYKSINYI